MDGFELSQDDTSGFGVWFRVLAVCTSITIIWIIFYEPVINVLLPLAVAAPDVPATFEGRFKTFWFFWPIALMFASVIWGILKSAQKDYYEQGGYYG